jgi:hypothetical protein
MDPRRRLLHYLVINVFVSALVTGTIIFFYDRAHQTNCPNITLIPTLATTDHQLEATIEGVIGVGTLSDERMIIQNTGTTALVLTGWMVKDNKGVSYTFPQLTLYPDGKILLHTKSGTDTATDLYWGRTTTVWISGELVGLYDSQNIARAFYRIP